jgi:hypothetical protein
MAFAKQYFSSYKSNNDLDYYLEIWVDGYTGGNPSEISIGAGGPVITYETDQEDRFSPILSSQCVLPFMVKGLGTQSFIQTLRTTYQERQVYLHLYRANSSGYSSVKPIWSGFLVMDLGAGEDVSFPYEQKLTFVDGLSLLKDIDFVDLSNSGSETNIMGSYTQDNMYFGPATYIFWIREILNKAGFATTNRGVSIDWGFTTAINWYNETMTSTSQSSDPMALTQCIVSMFHTKNDQDVYTPENCYTVLKQLLRHWGARITYWKHELWIVQIPEYIQDEAGFIDNPNNINTRQYNRFGAYQGSQDHLGDTYYTRYEQTIASNQVSKLVGTKYNYLPIIHRVSADFLSFASKNYYGGFPFGTNATSQEIFQGTIVDPSSANFIWLSIPLNWVWDMSQAGSSNVNLSNGHTNGWWCSVKFNFYASDGSTTYYLQYNSSNGSFYWVLAADWSPLGNRSPRYVVKSRNLTETNYIGFQEQLAFVDSSGNAITMNGAWSFFLDIEDYGTSSSNAGSFYCNFSGYNNPTKMRNPNTNITIVNPLGVPTKSGTVSWSNTLQDPSAITVPSTILNPAGFNAGTNQDDIRLVTQSSFKGFLQTLNTTQNASFGQTVNTQISNTSNSEIYSFGTLLWGDTIQQVAVGSLRVSNGSAFVKTDPSGKWGRGTLSGTQTFTELLIDEFITGQVKVAIAPTMRLAVGDLNKNQTATGQSGPATRPRYVNPIGRLRETRSNQTDPEYIFRRGSFYTLYDEWDYEGYQILRDTSTTTTTTTDLGGLGGGQVDNPLGNAKVQGPVTNALMMNSPVAYTRAAVPATGSDVAVNGNFNVATGWTLGAGWSIDTTAKKASFTATGSTSDLTQLVLTQGLTYQINFTVVVSAGSLLVKAGSSGTTETITTSGDYSIYLNCEGSSVIKFQAGTTFTGTITHITARDQKSLSSLPINVIGNTVFKTGDTFNIVNSIGDEIIPLTVTSNQGASDDTISVTAVPLYDDIAENSVLLINQDDLSEQYQNKTKGTVGGFDITATSIDSGSVAISSYIDDDTFGTASATSLATSESIKAYVDGQAGLSENLQTVTNNGNTTTNSVNIGSSTSPANKLTVTTSTSSDGILGISTDGSEWLKILNTNSTTFPVGQFYLYYGSNVVANITALSNEMRLSGGYTTGGKIVFRTATTERMRLTDTGLGIGTSSPSNKIQIETSNNNDGFRLNYPSTNSTQYPFFIGKSDDSNYVRVNANIIALKRNGATSTLKTEGSSNDLTLQSQRHLIFNTSDANERARITSGGSLLIGQTSEDTSGDYILQVHGDILVQNNKGVYVDNNTNYLRLGNKNSGIIELGGDTTNSVVKSRFNNLQLLTTRTADDIIFTANNTEVMRIDAGTSNVGIGTSSPNSKMQINVGTDQNIGFNSSSNLARISSYNDAFSASSPLLINGSDIRFTVSTSEKMRLTSGGNLLIGTTTDGGEKLQVVKASDTKIEAKATTAGAFFKANSVGNGYFGIELFNDSTAKWFVGTYADHASINANDFAIVSGSKINGDLRFKIDSSGDATFSGQVTIPATPVASTDAASKSYVDAQVGTADTLSEVLALGNTTGGTDIIVSHNDQLKLGDDGEFQIWHQSGANGNSFIDETNTGDLYIRSNSAIRLSHYANNTASAVFNPSGNVELYYNTAKKFETTTSGVAITGGATFSGSLTTSNGNLLGSSFLFVNAQSSYLQLRSSSSDIYYDGVNHYFRNNSGSSILTKITSGGNVLIGTTTDGGEKLRVEGNVFIHNSNATLKIQEGTAETYSFVAGGTSLDIKADSTTALSIFQNGDVLVGGASYNGSKLNVNGTATFSGQVTIPATPVASTDAASKGYVDAQVGTADTLSEVLALGNTSGANDIIMANNQSYKGTHLGGGVYGLLTLTSGNVIKMGGYDYASAAVEIGCGDHAKFLIGLTEKMRLNSTGLGIGTSSPNVPLEVNGNARFGDSSTGIAFGIVSTDVYQISGADTGFSGWNSLHFKADSNDGLFLQKDTNNVGIGTTSPSQKLDVNGNIKAYTYYVGNTSNYIDIATGLRLRSGSDGIRFMPNGADAVKFLANGNVLIGTTTDSGEKLQVNGRVQTNAGGLVLGDTNAVIHRNSNNLNLITYSGYSITMSAGNSESTRFLANGNVLIGTTTDSGARLYVNGVIRAVGGGIQAAQDYGFTLNDEAGNNRYGLKFGAAGTVGGSDLLMLTNRSIYSAATSGGIVTIGGNSSTTGVSEVEIARFDPRVTATSGTQKKVTLDAVLELTAQTDPADPANNKSIIWMDTNGNIKAKMTDSGGTTVTRTIAAFEG